MSTGQVTPPIRPPGQGNGRGASIVNIVKIPEALETNAKTIRLEGKIAQSNTNNNTARIETEYGNIDIKIRGRQALTEGQRIIVEIPAGRPPRQAAIQPDRSAAPQNTNQGQAPTTSQNVVSTAASESAPRLQVPTPTVTQGSQAAPAQQNPPSQQATNYQPVAQSTGQNTNQNTGQNLVQTPAPNLQSLQNTTRQTLPPLPTEIQAALTRSAATPSITAQPQTTSLLADNVVRLIPVSPAQAQAAAVNSNQSVTALSASLSNASLSNNLTTISLTPSALSAQTGLQTAAALSTTSANLTLGPSPQVSLTPATLGTANIAQQTAIPHTQIIPQGQTIAVPSAGAFLAQQSQTNITGQTATATAAATSATPSAQSASLTAVPINFDPTNPASFLQPRSTPIDVQIIKITPPNAVLTTPTTGALNTATPAPLPATTPFTPPLLSGNSAITLTAKVTGFTAQGLPLITVQSPASRLPQSFILQHNSNNLTLGSQLQISARPPVGVSLATPLVTPQNINPLLQGFQWPAMDDLFNGLLQLSPQAAASLSRSLPSPANALQIAPAAMMFIAAIKAGDIGQFLGQQKIDLLQNAGKESILNRLTTGGGATQAAAPEAQSSSEWRAVPLPMFWEGEIHRVTLYTRSESQKQQHDNEGNGRTRFVFDLSLSRMGDVQIDGLLHDERLDLVVRTHHAFTEPMQQTMRQAYSSALDYTSLSGELNFQGTANHWVHVLEKNEQLGVDV